METESSTTGPVFDFDELDESLLRNRRPSEREKVKLDFKKQMDAKLSEIERTAPNLKAVDQYEALQEKERDVTEEFEVARKEQKEKADLFNSVKQRYELFMDAFNHISSNIDKIYKQLTKSITHPPGGTAYLNLENDDDPFLRGIKYTTMPPTKRFRDMEEKSGGEKTVAALALLFSIHRNLEQMYNRVPVLEPSYGYYLEQIEIWDRFVFGSNEFVKLTSTHQKFFKDILDAMVSRYEKGIPIGLWDINSIVVRDNVACLPPVSETGGSLSLHPVQLFFNLVIGVLGTEGCIPSRDSFYHFLMVLIHEKDAEACKNGLKSLCFHPLLNSSKDNTNFIGEALAYLRQNESYLEKGFGNRSWQAQYEDWASDKTYDIGNAVKCDKYFKLVYQHQEGGYSNTSIGLLHYMKNLFKHLNDHRRKDGAKEWSDEQIEMTTELYFPGEMQRFYEFLWYLGIPMDFRKVKSPIPLVYQKANTGEIPISANSEKSLGTSNALPAIRTHLATRELKIIKISDIRFKGVLSSGTYRDVSCGIWKAPKESINVAIKQIKKLNFTVGQLQRLRADFWKEVQVLRQLNHPNIVAFHGVVINGPVLAMVTEYMANGSLGHVIGKNLTVDYRKKLMIALDAATGMDYLHRKGFVHFALRLSNLLLDMRDPERPKCKIGDLGLFGYEQSELVSVGVGTIPWMAPELLHGKSKNNKITEKANVYSFAIIMWELLIWKNPYSNLIPVGSLAGIIKGSYPLPSWFNPTWLSLTRRCWSSDPESRPHFSEIAMELRAMLAATNNK